MRSGDLLMMLAAAGLVITGAMFLTARKANAGGYLSGLNGTPILPGSDYWKKLTAPGYLARQAAAEADWSRLNPPVDGWTVG